MSIPVFKDIEKSTKDFFDEDYDTKNVLKVKSSGPFGVNFTTASEHKAGKGGAKGNIGGKISLKWAPASGGFSVDKFEVKPDGAIAIETSLVGVAPGLKLEFKGDDSYKGDLGLIYKTPLVSATAELDLVEFSKFKGSVSTKSGPIVGGANIAFDYPAKTISALDFAASVTLPNSIFASVKTVKKLSEYNFSLSYLYAKNISLASLFSLSPAKGFSGLTFGASYKCNATTALKFKVNQSGVLAASVKQTLEKNASATLVAEVDVPSVQEAKLGAVKFGLTANLG